MATETRGNDRTNIRIRKFEIPLEPSTSVFHVMIESKGGVWEETIGSEENLRWFLKGVQVGASPWEHIPQVEIPQESEPLPEELLKRLLADDDLPF